MWISYDADMVIRVMRVKRKNFRSIQAVSLPSHSWLTSEVIFILCAVLLTYCNGFFLFIRQVSFSIFGRVSLYQDDFSFFSFFRLRGIYQHYIAG